MNNFIQPASLAPFFTVHHSPFIYPELVENPELVEVAEGPFTVLYAMRFALCASCPP